jgi:hypothetical protein
MKEAMPYSLPRLVALPDEVYDVCLNAADKFAKHEICFDAEEEDKCDAHYKRNGIRSLCPDKFWLKFNTCYGRNSTYAVEIMEKLSTTYGVENALKDFKTPPMVLSQQLKKSGVEFDGTLKDAIEQFGLPEGTTAEQAHFLLTCRQ